MRSISKSRPSGDGRCVSGQPSLQSQRDNPMNLSRIRKCSIAIALFICLYQRTIVECFQFHNYLQRTSLGDQGIGCRRIFSSYLRSKKNLVDEIQEIEIVEGTSRRRALQGIAAAVATIPLSAGAGLPELDSTGELYSPRTEMLSGGSKAARGVPVSGKGGRLQPGQVLQTVYETRFIAYLSRFLLNFDPAANAWWVKQGLGDSWEQRTGSNNALADNTFAAFAESVEVGLADYFVGPYGSYSSVSAATAGLLAAQPARSTKPEKEERGFFDLLFGRQKVANKMDPSDSVEKASNGILNLYSLLKARYNSVTAKRQLAILFSFISSPRLQPVNEIRALLGEADNATVTQIELIKPRDAMNEADSRTSSRRGGGYSLTSFPEITIDAPPALGDEYRPAEAVPIMRPTSRVLRIQVLDGGEGYTSAPQVTVVQTGFRAACQAAAILDREGHIESILVLDPGYGYGGRKETSPKVKIEAPKSKRKDQKSVRRATAVAELEYEIVGVDIIRGGNGFSKTEPPEVEISPPEEDPDWFISIQEQPEMRMVPVVEKEGIRAEVAEMRYADGNVAYSRKGVPISGAGVDDELLDRLQRDPLEMLPSSIRPDLQNVNGRPVYIIPSLARIPQFVANLSPRYRACDPVFGGVGRIPVTKGATALSASEYARLALSGAVCTVVVRTLLNPLELIKTKQQLENDEELLNYAKERVGRKRQSLPVVSDESDDPASRLAQARSLPQSNETLMAEQESSVALLTEAKPLEQSPDHQVKLGTMDMIQSLIELRGPLALFQSADITFLASIVFGSLGFGATELFRRSFTASFFSDVDGSDKGSELVLLLAAALATVVTAAAASPFELLRVRSMALVEPEKWTTVLKNFLEPEESSNSTSNTKEEGEEEEEEFDLRTLKPRDVLPLWAGFAPTVSRELPFAVTKFLIFDLIAKTTIAFLNSQAGEGALPVQIGVGPVGLTVSAASGAIAGIAGAIVSHPADLILTLTSSSSKKAKKDPLSSNETQVEEEQSWKDVIKDLISREGGIANLFVGLPARATFFFLVIGLQFFLYDYVKSVLQVGSEDLNLVLDVFYAVRAGLVGMAD